MQMIPGKYVYRDPGGCGDSSGEESDCKYASVVVLILVVTSLCLCVWTYRGVIAPLNLLKKATNNIKEGNLDFVVEGCDVAEINDLCQDFEEMRQRLKASTEEKVKFDKENKELIEQYRPRLEDTYHCGERVCGRADGWCGQYAGEAGALYQDNLQ